ncbi:MAG: hypothetical protein OXQ92_10550 [Boseongicola sp.]|nr:hypothetical protein [Boseongicola sp.]MDD9976306.1 hypothetical protein [Boseongicola sp.]
MLRLLGTLGRHGRWCLVLGLIAGMTLPGVAAALRPWLPEMIVALLFLAALRIGPQASIGSLKDLRESLGLTLLFQLLAPLVAFAILAIMGVAAAPWALALVLVLAAPPITGGPNFTLLMHRDPSGAMRLLLLGTLLFPLTALPILWLSPAFDTYQEVLLGAARLVGAVFGSVGVAFLLRHLFRPKLASAEADALEGLAALLLGIVVVGLMAAVGPALSSAPLAVLGWLALAAAINFGSQIFAHRTLPLTNEGTRTGISIAAGNRNIALFLVALPDASVDTFLLFIGCYQVPMYLTPIVMRRFIAH